MEFIMNKLAQDYNNAQISNNVLQYNFPHAWEHLTKDLNKKAFLAFVDEFHVGTL